MQILVPIIKLWYVISVQMDSVCVDREGPCKVLDVLLEVGIILAKHSNFGF